MTLSRKTLVLISFLSIFLAVRIASWQLSVPSVAVLLDPYVYYVPAGRAYVTGSLPDSLNPEHPPLAKYIIGIFAVYLRSPNASSVLFSFLTAATVFLIARRLKPDTCWAAVAIWLLTFDPINISASVHPALDIFMLFFALGGLYILLIARNKLQYALAGLMFGLAMASKWPALFIIIPAVIFTLAHRRYLGSFLILLAASGAYVLSYIDLIVRKGFTAFLNLQIWMVKVMVGTHALGVGKNLFLSSLSTLIYYSTTFVAVSWYNPALHPEAFRLFGSPYISVADSINPLITLLLFPTLWVQARKYALDRDRTRLLLLLVLLSLTGGEIAFPASIALWYHVPVNAVICIFASDMLSDLKNREGKKTLYLYLALVGIWVFYAGIIASMRVAYQGFGVKT